jgi:hypothetical protein
MGFAPVRSATVRDSFTESRRVPPIAGTAHRNNYAGVRKNARTTTFERTYGTHGW